MEKIKQTIKDKAISAFIESCEYKSDQCCWCAIAHGCDEDKPDICLHENCASVKRFIDKLNEEYNK